MDDEPKKISGGLLADSGCLWDKKKCIVIRTAIPPTIEFKHAWVSTTVVRVHNRILRLLIMILIFTLLFQVFLVAMQVKHPERRRQELV